MDCAAERVERFAVEALIAARKTHMRLPTFESDVAENSSLAESAIPTILLSSDDTQIGEFIVVAISVDVIDFTVWPLAIHVEPRKSVSQEALIVDANFSISRTMRCAANDRTSLHWPPLGAGGENSGLSVIGDEREQSLMLQRLLLSGVQADHRYPIKDPVSRASRPRTKGRQRAIQEFRLKLLRVSQVVTFCWAYPENEVGCLSVAPARWDKID
nr:hypothetical protein [Bradyrhizobium genosp. L]